MPEPRMTAKSNRKMQIHAASKPLASMIDQSIKNPVLVNSWPGPTALWIIEPKMAPIVKLITAMPILGHFAAP